MIKFEEHEGKLFRMLDKPVPLKEKDTNVLVQFITHGIIGEYVMEHWLDCGQENAPIFVDSVDSDGDVTVCIENGNEHHCCPFPMFEIIGTLVKEGSKEWALYQMMQGEKVCHETSPWDWYRMYNDHVIQNRIVGYMDRVSAWLESTVQSGWQIYNKTAKEPIADCDNCKHRCPKSNIDHCQMYEPKPTFKVGDWVKYMTLFLQVIEPSGKNRTTCRTPSGTIIYPSTSCLTKVSPSEVEIRIGCLSGTVINGIDSWFHLIGTNRKTIATIRIESLDTRTRKLVESLLEAMQEEDK